MKKLYSYITMAILALTLFTSCEPLYLEEIEDRADRREARTIDGSWTGYIDTYYYDRWGLTGESYRTTMYFERENDYGGWGYEVDYDLNSRYADYYYCEFRWEIYRGNIRIRYADSWNDVYINDYTLSDTYFRGYMDDGTSTDIVFQLSYDSRFDWSYWNTRSYTRSVDGSEQEDSTTGSVKASGKFAKTE